jgi:hypothetical protein
MGFDMFASSIVWGLFIAIVLLPLAGNKIYATLGVLSSITAIVAIVSSSIFGKLIDRKKGDLLLKTGVGINVIGHLFRAFISTTFGAVGVNLFNEVAATSIGMSFMRGIFDIADTSGYRMMYLMLISMVKSVGAAIASVTVILLILLSDGNSYFQIYYIITAIVCSFVFFCRFKLYRS